MLNVVDNIEWKLGVLDSTIADLRETIAISLADNRPRLIA